MSRNSVQLLGSSDGHLNLTGEPIRADAWYGYTDGSHTVAIYVNNFRGRVWLEASLANDPTDEDWFPIMLNGDIPYLEYPRNRMRPSGQLGGDTGVDAYNFVANIMWIRARVDRSHILPVPATIDQIAQLGGVRKIMLNN